MTVADELPKGCKRSDDLRRDAGLMNHWKTRPTDRMFGAELTAQPGYAVGAKPAA